jgi:hypothetical protein
MSTINTNGINVNYPVPGVNNNSQGFRDNFASIRTNLNTAANEITDLQNKVVVKSALANSIVNNDMANTLISNALTRSFRASTYNLGGALSGIVSVNVSLGDVQYGTIAGNTTIQFTGWSPTGTQSNVQLQLAVSNNLATISLPAEVTTGVTSLENYANVANTTTITVPYGVTQLDYRFSTIDCGNTIVVEPYNNSRVASQVQSRTPSPTGSQGDVAGDVAVDANYIYVCTGSFDSNVANTISIPSITSTYAGNLIDCVTTSSLRVNSPIIFNGTTWGNIVANTVYYIKTIPDSANITISATGFSGIAGSTFVISAGTGAMAANSYNGTAIWKSIELAGLGSANQTIQGSLTVGGLLAVSSSDTVTAAGTFQSNATLLSNNINIVTTAPTSSGVKLPIAVAGYRIIIRNNTANTINVYPNTGSEINGGSINVPVTLGASSSTEYFCSTSAISNVGGHWYTLNSTYA